MADPVNDPSGVFDLAEAPERPGLGARLAQGDLGGFAAGLVSMGLPTAGMPGQRSLEDIARNMTEFTGIGDVADLSVAADPSSGMDPLERVLAALPFLGVGGLAAHAHYRNRVATKTAEAHYRKQVDQIRLDTREALASMSPVPGQVPIEFPTTPEQGAALTEKAHSSEARQTAQFEYSRRHWVQENPQIDAVLSAASWEELREQTRDVARVMPAAVGEALVQEMPPGTYGTEVPALVAAKSALAKAMKLAEEGRLKLPDSPQDQLLALVDLEKATTMMGIGPDLEVNVHGELVDVRWDPEQRRTRVFAGLHGDLLPSEKLYDHDRSQPVRSRTDLEKRLARVSYNSLVGHMAVNLRKVVERALTTKEGRQRLAHGAEWYFKAHKTAKALADATSMTIHQAAGVISALSPRTFWMPDNIVGAVHLALQTRTDLVPGSPEYTQTFSQIVQAGGWGDELLRMETQPSTAFNPERGVRHPVPARNRFSSVPQALEFYADPENFKTGTGHIRGTQLEKNREAALNIMAGLPWQMQLRASKTHQFASLIADPTQIDLAVIDAWSNRATLGSIHVGEPLGSRGDTRLSSDVYYDPFTKAEIRAEDIDAHVERVGDELGYDKAKRKALANVIRRIPNRAALERYRAQMLAHALLRDEMGLEFNHQAQAGVWTEIREMMDSTVEGPYSVNDVINAARLGTFDDTIIRLVEGDADLSLNPAGMVFDIAELDEVVPLPAELGKARKGQPVILEPTVSGRVVPWVDTTDRRAIELVRHAVPSGIRVGDYEAFVPAAPKQVLRVEDHLKDVGQLRDDKGAVVGAQVRTYVGNVPPTGTLPGTHIEVDVDAGVDPAGFLSELTMGTDLLVQEKTAFPSQVSQTATGRQKVSNAAWNAIPKERRQQFLEESDWVGMTAWRSDRTQHAAARDMFRMVDEIRRAGGEVVWAEGAWVDTEAGFQDVSSRLDPELARIADEYMASAGIEPAFPLTRDPKINEQRAMEIADYIEDAPSIDDRPEVLESYEALVEETMAQYRALVDAGYTFEWGEHFEGEVDSSEIHRRVIEDKHLQVFATLPGFEEQFPGRGKQEMEKLAEKNPLFRYAGVKSNGFDLTFNDIFRAVHDVFGHSKARNTFGPIGEENAWRTHARMFSDKARPAMTYETRAQNSWVNFGRHIRREDGTIPAPGDPDYIPPRDRPFSEQKMGILPDELGTPDPGVRQEPSLFVTGLSYKDAIRIAKKYGQREIATRHGMIDPSAGTVRPALQVREGAGNGGYTRIGDYRFNVEYDENPMPLPADPDELVAAGHQPKKVKTVVLGVGDRYSGLNHSQVQRLWKSLESRSEVKSMRGYFPGQMWTPEGAVDAWETYVNDAAGVNAAILHGQEPGRPGPNTVRVTVPQWQRATLGSKGLDAEVSARTPEQAREVMTVDEAGGMVWFDQDIAIQALPEQDVQMTARGNIFNNLRVDGKRVSKAVLLTDGPQPILNVQSLDEVARPGSSVVHFDRNGNVSKIEAVDVQSAVQAQRALERIGALSGDITVELPPPVTPEGYAGAEAETPSEVRLSLGNMIPQKMRRALWSEDIDPTPRDLEVEEFLLEELGVSVPVRVPAMSDAQVGTLKKVLRGLHGLDAGDSAFARFQEEFGALPRQIWWSGVAPTEIITAQFDELVAAGTHPNVLAIDDRLLAWEQKYGKLRGSIVVDAPGRSNFELTLVHEIAHLIDFRVQQGPFTQAIKGMARDTVIDARDVSEYAADSYAELWAEVFAKAVYQPRDLTARQRYTVRKVMQMLETHPADQ